VSPSDDVTDAELAEDIASGSPAAEAELCRRFAPRIRLYGLRHLRDEDRARDLVQSVLLAVLEAVRARRVDDPARLERFVLGTCRHLALRARHADARAEPTDVASLDAPLVVSESNAVDFEALFRCMAMLEAREQAVLHMSFYREKSSDEIASVLDTTAGNVRVVRHRAVARLRRCLEQPKEVMR
jgi:RNA polymerase sigma-70 factor (ECF subfamily)